MDPDKLKKLIKQGLIIAIFFLAALGCYLIGGRVGRSLLVAYVLIVTVVTVLAILLQSGRGGGLASLGGMGGDSLLGTHSSTPIAKLTYVLMALFLFICMLLARPSARPVKAAPGVLDSEQQEFPQEGAMPPALPGGGAQTK